MSTARTVAGIFLSVMPFEEAFKDAYSLPEKDRPQIMHWQSPSPNRGLAEKSFDEIMEADIRYRLYQKSQRVHEAPAGAVLINPESIPEYRLGKDGDGFIDPIVRNCRDGLYSEFINPDWERAPRAVDLYFVRGKSAIPTGVVGINLTPTFGQMMQPILHLGTVRYYSVIRPRAPISA